MNKNITNKPIKWEYKHQIPPVATLQLQDLPFNCEFLLRHLLARHILRERPAHSASEVSCRVRDLTLFLFARLLVFSILFSILVGAHTLGQSQRRTHSERQCHTAASIYSGGIVPRCAAAVHRRREGK